MAVNGNDEKDRRITAMRALAIFFVVCAHVASVRENTSPGVKICSNVYILLGTWGVPVFFVISGLLFDRTKQGLKEFVKKRICTIILPWLFCYTFLWLYVILRKDKIVYKNWLRFVLGYYTSAYYITMLLVMYVIFWFLRKHYFGILLLTVLSFALTVVYPLSTKLKIIDKVFADPYLNPLFWMFWFGLGMLLGYKDYYEKVMDITKKILPLSALGVAVINIYCIHSTYLYNYFSMYSVWILLLTTVFIMGLSQYLCMLEKIVFAGKYSFSIYLLNQFLTGAIVFLTNKIDNIIAVLLRPFIVILLILLFVYVIRILSKKVSAFKILLNLVGVNVD